MTGSDNASAREKIKGQDEKIASLKQANQNLIKERLESRLNRDERASVESIKASEKVPSKPLKQTKSVYPIGCEKYLPLVEKYSWPVEIVLAIMYAESGCDPNAISPTNDHGLLQLHNVPIYDPAKNIAYAYNGKYLKGGFSHWTVCNVGKVRCWEYN